MKKQAIINITFEMICTRGVVIAMMIVGAVIGGIPQLMMTPRAAASAEQTDDDNSRTFQSEEDGFRLQIPQGWVIQDHNVLPYDNSNTETIAVLCLEDEALPAIGGESNCQGGALTDQIFISKWSSDLKSMPEFQIEPNRNITTNDLVALWIRNLQNVSVSQIKIINTTDVDEFTKLVEFTSQFVSDAGTFLPLDDFTVFAKTSGMFVLSPDRNTGYAIVNNIDLNYQTEHSPAVQEVFNSFEVVEDDNNNMTTTTA
jgi:hypothetical protein